MKSLITFLLKLIGRFSCDCSIFLVRLTGRAVMWKFESILQFSGFGNKKDGTKSILIDYEQSLFFLIVRRERSEKNRPRESWPRESWWQGRRKKRDYGQSLSVWPFIDYEQSLFFLIVRRERSEKNRPRESWPCESSLATSFRAACFFCSTLDEL